MGFLPKHLEKYNAECTDILVGPDPWLVERSAELDVNQWIRDGYIPLCDRAEQMEGVRQHYQAQYARLSWETNLEAYGYVF